MSFEEEVRAFFSRVLQRREGRRWVPKYACLAQVSTQEGDRAFVEIRQGDVSVRGQAEGKPDLYLRADRKLYQRIWSGETTAGEAWWKGELELGEPGQILDASHSCYPWFTMLIRIAQGHA